MTESHSSEYFLACSIAQARESAKLVPLADSWNSIWQDLTSTASYEGQSMKMAMEAVRNMQLSSISLAPASLAEVQLSPIPKLKDGIELS